jgi:hypothetical protein
MTITAADLAAHRPFPQWRFLQLTAAILAWMFISPLLASVGSALGLVAGMERVEQTLDVVFTIPVTAACAVGVLRFAFRAERPTLDGIFAMVVAYLLIAILFAELQVLTLVWDHGAVHLPESIDQLTWRQLRGELVYFSLITLATVGYGDILPVSSTARMLATTEAVIGQFYVAVVVATFVSMYTTQALTKRADAVRPPQEDADRGSPGPRP